MAALAFNTDSLPLTITSTSPTEVNLDIKFSNIDSSTSSSFLNQYPFTTTASIVTDITNSFTPPTSFISGTATSAYTVTVNKITFTNSMGNIKILDATGPYEWVLTPKENLKDIIKSRMTPTFIKKHYLENQVSPQEQVARDSLRDIISEAQWRRYITNSFLMVKGNKTGRFYQVFKDGIGKGIRVYEKGRRVQDICIHTVKDCPPTDHIINMKTLIEYDEEYFLTLGNITSRSNDTVDSYIVKDQRNLVELFKEYKKQDRTILRVG